MFSVTQFGKELDPSLYEWSLIDRTFTTNESNLVLNFTNYSAINFKTGNKCTFKVGHNCTFNVGEKCCLHYDWCGFFEVHKLPDNSISKILTDGNLISIERNLHV